MTDRTSPESASAKFECREFREDAFRSMEVQICGETKTIQFCAEDHGGDHPTAPAVAIGWADAIDLATWILSHTSHLAQRQQVTDDMIERAIEAHVEPFDSGDAVGAMRAALEAALSDTSTDRASLDAKSAVAAAEAICDYADNNLSMFEACCEEDSVKARELYEAAKRLRDLFAGLVSSPARGSE